MSAGGAFATPTPRLRARPYGRRDEQRWDEFVDRSWNGTFLHTRRYLDCSASRFHDESLVVEDANGSLAGVFPAAMHASEAGVVESHPASGYGGLVHAGALRGTRMRDALEAVAEHYYHEGKRVLRYAATPPIYHRVPAGDDLYALFALGAGRTRCDLSSVIDIANRPAVRKGRRSARRKAERAGVRVVVDEHRLDEFWAVLSSRLGERHQAKPRHALAEMRELSQLFPERIACAVGTLEGHVLAGALLFRTGLVDHTAYLAASELGQRSSALDLVVEHCIAAAREQGVRYFSFGNSTFYGGRVFSESLHEFKSGFGAGGVVYETYDLPLD